MMKGLISTGAANVALMSINMTLEVIMAATLVLDVEFDEIAYRRNCADYPMNNYQYLYNNAYRGSDFSQVPLTPGDAPNWMSTNRWDRATGKKYGYNRPDQRGDRVGADIPLSVRLGCNY